MRTLSILAVLAALAAPVAASAQIDIPAGYVQNIVTDRTRPCVFFQLDNRPEADPAVFPGQPWFAVHTSHRAYQELFAMLLTARASRLKVTVRTTGQGTPDCSGLVGVDILATE